MKKADVAEICEISGMFGTCAVIVTCAFVILMVGIIVQIECTDNYANEFLGYNAFFGFIIAFCITMIAEVVHLICFDYEVKTWEKLA